MTPLPPHPTQEERSVTSNQQRPSSSRNRWTGDREKCRRCGYLRVNVVHEQDPEHAPEGPDYYAAIREQMHEFVPSGEFDE